MLKVYNDYEGRRQQRSNKGKEYKQIMQDVELHIINTRTITEKSVNGYS